MSVKRNILFFHANNKHVVYIDLKIKKERIVNFKFFIRLISANAKWTCLQKGVKSYRYNKCDEKNISNHNLSNSLILLHPLFTDSSNAKENIFRKDNTSCYSQQLYHTEPIFKTIFRKQLL